MAPRPAPAPARLPPPGRVSGGTGMPLVYDLSAGQSRTTIPKGALYYGADGSVRRNDNFDAGNPIIRQAPNPDARIGRDGNWYMRDPVHWRSWERVDEDGRGYYVTGPDGRRDLGTGQTPPPRFLPAGRGGSAGRPMDLSRFHGKDYDDAVNSLVKGAYYYGPDGSVRRNENGAAGNPIVNQAPMPGARLGDDGAWYVQDPHNPRSWARLDHDGGGLFITSGGRRVTMGAATPPMPGARMGEDGNWYIEDPHKPGSWARVDHDGRGWSIQSGAQRVVMTPGKAPIPGARRGEDGGWYVQDRDHPDSWPRLQQDQGGWFYMSRGHRRDLIAYAHTTNGSADNPFDLSDGQPAETLPRYAFYYDANHNLRRNDGKGDDKNPVMLTTAEKRRFGFKPGDPYNQADIAAGGDGHYLTNSEAMANRDAWASYHDGPWADTARVYANTLTLGQAPRIDAGLARTIVYGRGLFSKLTGGPRPEYSPAQARVAIRNGFVDADQDYARREPGNYFVDNLGATILSTGKVGAAPFVNEGRVMFGGRQLAQIGGKGLGWQSARGGALGALTGGMSGSANSRVGEEGEGFRNGVLWGGAFGTAAPPVAQGLFAGGRAMGRYGAKVFGLPLDAREQGIAPLLSAMGQEGMDENVIRGVQLRWRRTGRVSPSLADVAQPGGPVQRTLQAMTADPGSAAARAASGVGKRVARRLAAAGEAPPPKARSTGSGNLGAPPPKAAPKPPPVAGADATVDNLTVKDRAARFIEGAPGVQPPGRPGMGDLLSALANPQARARLLDAAERLQAVKAGTTAKDLDEMVRLYGVRRAQKALGGWVSNPASNMGTALQSLMQANENSGSTPGRP